MQHKYSDTEIQRLREARLAAGLTLEQLAELTGYALTTLSSVENGHDQPSARLVSTIVQNLNLNPDWIKTGRGEMISSTRRPAKASFLPSEKTVGRYEQRAKRLRDMAAALNAEAAELESEIAVAKRQASKAKKESE